MKRKKNRSNTFKQSSVYLYTYIETRYYVTSAFTLPILYLRVFFYYTKHMFLCSICVEIFIKTVMGLYEQIFFFFFFQMLIIFLIFYDVFFGFLNFYYLFLFINQSIINM